MDNKSYHKGCAEAKGAGLTPAQVGKNPVITEQRRAPRDAFRYFGARELNPKRYPKEVEKVWQSWKRQMGKLISESDLADARAQFEHLVEFGKSGKIHYPGYLSYGERLAIDAGRRLARELNPEYRFGPTGYRPPAKWFSKMAESSAASYFGKKLKDLTKTEKAKVGQIVGGVWAKFSDATRLEILKKYEPSAVRANPIQMLSCPICGVINPVNRAGVYLKCSSCKNPLMSVKVRR